MKIARRRCALQYLDILPVKVYSLVTRELSVVSGVTFLLKTFVGTSEFPFPATVLQVTLGTRTAVSHVS